MLTSAYITIPIICTQMNVSKSIEFFYNKIMDTSSNDESDGCTGTLMHEHTEV
jgi:hypothetical protein